jgi:hypothetical protein
MRLTIPRRLPLLLALGAAVAGVAGCDLEFEKVTVPAGSSLPVVHAVLNPFVSGEFTVLLERTLGGRVSATTGRFDRNDPIVTSGGEPITQARVVIRRQGDEGVGTELVSTRTDGKGRGVYTFLNAGCSPFVCPTNGIGLTRGVEYTLEVQTPTGEVLTGTTTIPLAIPASDTGLRRIFDAENDTYLFRWRPSEGLGRYAVQIQTPYGPFQTFSDVESLAVNGSLRNFQQDRFPRVFVPGFLQPLQALAVDRNYFDYYRSENNPFTGQGLVSRIVGGTGLFGAVQGIRYQDIDVVAPRDEPVDGVWVLLGDATGFPARLTTWADGAFASGKFEDVLAADAISRRGMLGTRSGNTLRLAVLNNQVATDTAWTYVAEVRGDTLFTSSPQRGDQRWRRVSTPAN